ncbi:probable adenylate kinase 6, chloroplastic isoform X2 [Phragmites australis]|uniref:probable adenylate kinase 6, chloroplastic isoform X2 n=1 Tax=Phragmites australis TaxID=29695 RepID=UPI002D77C51C|nr:probable adenylate kinase 6, chloroplastic isoform X2 [Phragmites australis]
MAGISRAIRTCTAASRRSLAAAAAAAQSKEAAAAGVRAATGRKGRDREDGRRVQWVFLGCPGVGKGTYASRLSQLLSVPHIATGDLVRDALASPNPLSKQEILEGVTDIDLVINLKLREEALLAKCLGRRMCSQCGGNFNVADIDIEGDNGARMYMPPLLPPPQCESKLITRSDDTEEVVKERLRVYHDLSEPVEEFYRARRKLLEFNLPGGIPESWPKLLQALNLEDPDNERSAAA